MGILTLLSDGDTFNPRRLFIGSTAGAIYDYDDYAYLYQKSDGSVPVTALEQPVGLVLDKRWGGARGSELKNTGTTGLVGTATAATYNTTTGAGSVTRVDSNNQSYVLFSDLTVGGWYAVNVTCTSGVIAVRAGTYSSTEAVTLAAGSARTFFRRADAGGYISITNTPSAGSATFTISSIRELHGLHAYQSTDAARPVLSARYNLLLATATLSTQSVTTLAASYTLTFTGTGTVTLSGTATGVKSAGTNVFTATAGTLTLTVSGSVTLADLRLTADANPRLPAYQRVTTATDYDSAGFPRFLRIDATDDFLQTASVDPGTDKVFVCVGVTKVSDVATASVIESGTDVGSVAGTFQMRAPSGTGLATFSFNSRGTATAFSVTAANYSSPNTAVVGGIGDVSGDSAIVRSNGVQVTVTTDQGTGNYTAQPIYIGARAGTSLRLNNGRIYPLVICFKSVTAGEIAATEAWVNARTRAY